MANRTGPRPIRTAVLIVAALALMALAPDSTSVPMPEAPAVGAIPTIYPPRPTYSHADLTELRGKADNGDAAAATELGEFYARRGATPPNLDEAFRWLTHAIDLGSTPARREFGLLLLRLPGDRRDPARAASMLRQAAEAGDTQAQAQLGMLYAWGDGVERDPDQALAWTRKAADRKDPWAMANMGLLLSLIHI